MAFFYSPPVACGPLCNQSKGETTYNEVIGDPVGLAPGGHDIGVVVGDDDDMVDALGLEGGLLIDEGGDVPLGARGGESTGDGDDDDLLVLELCMWEIRYQQAVSSQAHVGGGSRGGNWGGNKPLLALYFVGKPQAFMPAFSGV